MRWQVKIIFDKCLSLVLCLFVCGAVARASHDDSPYDKLTKQKIKFELKQIENVFQSIDDLLKRAIIKVSSIDSNGACGEELITDLSYFLSEPHDRTQIQNIIEKAVFRALTEDEQELLYADEKISFPQAIKSFWGLGLLSAKKARSLIYDNANMNSQEIIRLMENGASRTQKGHYVQLRTGDHYGDVLNLFQKINKVVKSIKSARGNDLYDKTIDDLIKYPLGPEVISAFEEEGLTADQTIGDATVINELRRHFLFASGLHPPIYFMGGMVDYEIWGAGSAATVEHKDFLDATLTPNSLSATLIGNYYLEKNHASANQSLQFETQGLGYSGSLNFTGQGPNWWLYYTDGFLGGGANYTVNFDQGTFWSNGDPSFLSVGFIAGGWRNYLTAGISLSTMFSNGVAVGATSMMAISRYHDVTYLGEYPFDGKFAEIRGFHKIEIDDTVGWSAMLSADFELSALTSPVTAAFRAGASQTKRRIYRTHVDLKKTKELLGESCGPGMLYVLGKKIKEARTPKFEDPEVLVVGDELVETKIGTLSGAFILGIESIVPLPAIRVGALVDITAEFELGLRRLPNDKYEVSIEPKRVYEMGLFATILNVIRAGHMKSLAMARKQIFIFDFAQHEARRAYFDLIHHGILPTSEELEVYLEDRGPEYLLTEFRAQNELLMPRGVARTYLEKIRVSTSKTLIDLFLPLMPPVVNVFNKIDKKQNKRLKLKFSGIDREFIRSQAKSVATNGLISVRRSTFGARRSEGQGFNGRYNQDLFVTHRRVHTIDDSHFEHSGNRWWFDSLVIHAQLEDTAVAGDQENKMAEKINRLFSTFIGSFERRNSKTPRVINIERSLTIKELDQLTRSECRDRIATASQMSGIVSQELTALIKKLKNKHPDHQGLIIKQFIESSPGLSGFAAIHQLLGAKPEDLFIRTESGYTAAIINAKKFIAMYTDLSSSDEGPLIALTPISIRKNIKEVKRFYKQARLHLREIDTQLRLLDDDKYLIDENSPLVKIYGENKVKSLLEAGVRQDKIAFKTALISSRKTILDLLDLDKQGFSLKEQKIIYQMAGPVQLRLQERAQLMFMTYESRPIEPSMDRRYIKKRLRKAWALISDIDSEINKVENDDVMNYMDHDYVETLKKQLHDLRRQIAQTASMDHLTKDQLDAIKRLFTSRTRGLFGIFHKKKQRNFRIDGALANTYMEPMLLDELSE